MSSNAEASEEDVTKHRIAWRSAGVMGLGLSGRAVAGFLARRGVAVIAADAKPEGQLAPGLADLERLGVALRLGPADGDSPRAFAGCEVVIASPGVPAAAKPLAWARSERLPVLAEVELASRFVRGVLIGITGSNGKSTVTALAGRMLKQAGLPTWVCGNIGTPLIEVVEADMALADEQARAVHYVTELSSFQLEGIETLAPHIAVLLNLSPDHQDRYASPRDYYAAKARIFMNQIGDDIAIVNWDDGASREVAAHLKPRLFPFSLTQDLEEGAVLSGQRLVLRRTRGEHPFMKASDVPLPGRHNLENVLAAAAVAFHCGAGVEAIAEAAAAFRGLPHRLELVAQLGGVSYYNDSKATNVGAALRAVEAFEGPVVLLVGGQDKGGDFEAMRAALSARRAGPSALRAVVSFGKAGADLARRLEGAAAETLRAGTLAEAVRAAAACARPGDVVLLAPACASFDAYTGFDRRGEDFRSIVASLPAQVGGAR